MLSIKDLLELNPNFGRFQYEAFGIPLQSVRSRVVSSLLLFPLQCFKHFLLSMRPKRWFPGRNKIIFFYATKNNYNALMCLINRLPSYDELI